MVEEECSRRRLLAGVVPAVAALAGCGAAGPGTDTPTDGGGAVGVGGSGAAGAGTTTATPTDSPTRTPTETAGNGSAGTDGTGNATGTATATATPAIQTATAPPGDAVEIDEVTLRLRRGGYYTVADADISLRNVGDYVFTRLELRVDLYYHPTGGDRRRVADTYVERGDFDGDDDDDAVGTFGPGDTTTLSPENLRFQRDSRAGGSTDPDDFSIEVEFRRVEYRPA